MRHHQHLFKENDMATAKKTNVTPLAKKARKTSVAPEKMVSKATTKVKAEQKFAMPMEVKEWIEKANSTINHLKGEVERLKAENKEMKAYKRWAEQRILRSDHE
jgi:uncharacterized small protein (DUF1192 family)